MSTSTVATTMITVMSALFGVVFALTGATAVGLGFALIALVCMGWVAGTALRCAALRCARPKPVRMRPKIEHDQVLRYIDVRGSCPLPSRSSAS